MRVVKYLMFILLLFTIACSRVTKQSEQKTNQQTIHKTGDKLDELMDIKNGEKLVATINTNIGSFEIELYAKLTPVTVKNFVGLTLKGYYDGVTFHRVIKDFMIQGGDPTGTGTSGESIYGGEFQDELNASLMFDSPGIIAMANRGPNTNTSQFFITVVPTPWLNGKHTIFGKVIGGMDVVNTISNVKTGQMDKPIDPVVMEKVTVEKK